MIDYTIIPYTSVYDIPDSSFENLGCSDSFYFSKAFLGAFEEGQENVSYHYLVFFENEKIVALAILQELDVVLGKVTENLLFFQKIASKVQSLLNGGKTHILVCGNVFLSGEYGLFVKKEVDRRGVYDTLSRKLKSFKTKKLTKIIFLKDYNAQQDTAASVAEKHHFQSFAVEPNMRLPLPWKSFAEYKATLKSKYRTKINRADSLSKHLTTKFLTSREVVQLKDELTSLYHNVTKKSTFNAANFNVETYGLLKERFSESVYIQTYRKGEKLVGFLTAFHNDDLLDAHFIGIDYNFNKIDAIYPRMLNDYVRLGFKLGVKEINLGRTASEIKSTLGALPEHLRCYVRHKRTVANIFFKPLIRQIKMTEYKQHNPFK